MMLEKLKHFLGLNEAIDDAVGLRTEIHELKRIIKQQNAVLLELSQENMELGRDRQQMADIITRQQRRLDVQVPASLGDYYENERPRKSSLATCHGRRKRKAT